MTVFGRDTLITSLQTMLLGPELAIASLDALAALQAPRTIPRSTPSRARSCTSSAAAVPPRPGSAPTTAPSTRRRSSSSCSRRSGAGRAEPRSSRGCASLRSRALRWIDEYGDRDGDGFVEYERRTPRGLENQSWKDSGDSQRFHDGRFAKTPIAPAEVQGYVYDAKLRMAELARAVWGDERARRTARAEAAELRRRFDEAFWVDERGGYYALALDGDKRRVDSLCSNIGHLLWSGIVPPSGSRRSRAG